MSSQLFSGIAVLSFVLLLLILLLRRLKQPYFIAYIASGLLLGPKVLNIIHSPEVVSELGEIGIVLLMFSIGAHIDLRNLSKNFYKPLLIAFVQVALSFLFMYCIGKQVGWNINTIVLTSFIISLSSSAIVFQYLARTGEIKSQLGIITCGVLLMQDILVVPMILTLNFMSGSNASMQDLVKVCVGGILILLFLRAAITKKLFRIPMRREIIADHDLQVFIGFCICFGMAWISSWFGLSHAFGAFAAGIIIGRDKATRWLEKSFIPFRVFFMAFFFLAVGLQLDIRFFVENMDTIIMVTVSVLLINSLINSLLFKLTGNNWRDSIYGGALLSQIGEFSFMLATLGASLGLVTSYTYQITLAVITFTMLLTTIWLTIIQQLIYRLPIVKNMRI
ncbi:MAG: cation:proton antiporter [Flavobacterium lindanitolerans]|jgi:CPA2 family monovalent cation:H+ antiporter-2|uniref:cation:proton antiporter n=1 Tax=Flavobacterium lindanitolerans TaxID=428988 RepID=UPI001A61F5FC|nr:cation:proton antiporter [Flavobacterium lindanitolerans]MBL7869660.1 cation:proton antiporter [Flavobacterium lindanitolerans]